MDSLEKLIGLLPINSNLNIENNNKDIELISRVDESFDYLMEKAKVKYCYINVYFKINDIKLNYKDLEKDLALWFSYEKTRNNPKETMHINIVNITKNGINNIQPLDIIAMTTLDKYLKAYEEKDHGIINYRYMNMYKCLGFLVNYLYKKLINSYFKPNTDWINYKFYYNRFKNPFTGKYNKIHNDDVHRYFCDVIENICQLCDLKPAIHIDMDKMQLNDIYR